MPNVNVERMLNNVSGVLVGAFGDKVVIGILIRLLDDVTPGMAYRSVISNLPLFNTVNESDWQRWAKYPQKFHIREITRDRVYKEMNKYRPDIVGIIINTPGGIDWMDRQINFAKQKLGI